MDVGDAPDDVEEGTDRDHAVDELLALLFTQSIDHEEDHAQHQSGDEHDVVVDPGDHVPEPNQVGRQGGEDGAAGSKNEEGLEDFPELPLPERTDEDTSEEYHGDQDAQEDAPGAVEQVKVAHCSESFLLRPLLDERCRVVEEPISLQKNKFNILNRFCQA